MSGKFDHRNFKMPAKQKLPGTKSKDKWQLVRDSGDSCHQRADVFNVFI